MSKTSVLLLFTLILTGMVGFALYRTDRLGPIVAIITGSNTTYQAPQEQPAVTDTGVPEEKPDPVAVAVETKEPKVTEPVQTAEIKKDPVRDEDPVSAKYRAKYKAPKVGAPINLALSNNTKQAGTLVEISDNGITVKTDTYTLTVPKDKLSAASLAICYEDEYVKFMVAQRNKALAAKEKTTANKTESVQPEPIQTAPVPAEKPGEYAEYMKKNGASDALLQRQKRIKEEEAKMRAQGIDI